MECHLSVPFFFIDLKEVRERITDDLIDLNILDTINILYPIMGSSGSSTNWEYVYIHLNETLSINDENKQDIYTLENIYI